MNLSALIAPRAHVARSVNLERDQNSSSSLSQYRLTGKGLEILIRFVAALAGEPVWAWSITGPYGMGKSSFVRFLLALCGPERDQATRLAWEILGKTNPHLSRQLHQLMRKHKVHARGFLRVGVTASFEPLNRTLLKGLINALQHTQDDAAPELLQLAVSLSEHDIIETSELAQLFEVIPRKTGVPLVLVIDEFGKNLEYMARFPAQGDLYILQILAETPNVYLWVCLHQAFEEYTSRLSQRQMQEWAKIQGRFEDISFVEPRREMLRFIGETLVRREGDPGFGKAVRRWAEMYAQEARDLNLAEFRGMEVEDFERFYPLHPLAAVLLPELCVRFAQNDRTLFAFLCSGEPTALPAFLYDAPVDTTSWALPTFGPERLYDYFLASSSGSLLGRPQAQRWIEVHDLIERSRSSDPCELATLKTIGLLNLVSGPQGFRASQSLLSFAMFRPWQTNADISPTLADVLRAIQDKGVLIYREYADEYRLWEGSDFDISKAVQLRRSLLVTQSLEKVLKETVPLSPLTASRHSYLTGNLRHFERRWIAADSLAEDTALECAHDLDGLVLYAFGKVPSPPGVPAKTEDGRPVIVCYVPCEDEIRDAVLDHAAIQEVLRDSPELARDGVARKEAVFRAHAAEERLRGFLETIFVPGNNDARWFVLGRPYSDGPKNERDLSRVLSDCCDEVYAEAPWIRNELINRNRLSTAAARARRELMEAMVLRSSEEMLGFQRTGPEVAIYRTMLRQEGLHFQQSDGTWAFGAPASDSRYRKVWDFFDRTLAEAGDAEVKVTMLIEHLKRPPFGLKEGPIPVLLCHYMLVRYDEIALYQEGVFVPSLGPEDMELLTKRPELFSLRCFCTDKTQAKVLALYNNLLRARIQGDASRWRNPSLIAIVGPLVHFVKNLPKYSLQTQQVSRDAQQVRKTLLLARDPFDLLYVKLPQAVGIPPLRDEGSITEENLSEFQERFRRAILELRNAYSNLLREVETRVRKAFDHIGDLASLRQILKDRAQPLFERCGDPGLKPFVKTLAEFSGNDEAWLESIATLVARRPVDSWRDDDLKSFAVALADMVHRFKNLETMSQKLGRGMPQATNGRAPRMVTLTYPDGASISRIVWDDEKLNASVTQVVQNLMEKHGDDPSLLEALLLTLGERLLRSSSENDEDLHHAKKK